MTTKERLVLPTSDDDVLLKEFVKEDAETIFKLILRNREHLSQGTDTTSKKYPDVDSVLQSIDALPVFKKVRFGIWLDGVFAGSVNMTHYSKKTHLVEIGYWVGSEFCGRGLATIASLAIIEHARSLFCVDRVMAITDKENIASQKVLEKAGLIRDKGLESDLLSFFFLNVKTDRRISHV